MLKYLSQLSLDVSEVTYHANCTRSIPLQRLHQIEQSPVDKTGWIIQYGLLMLSPYSYTCIRPIQLETSLVRPGNVFPIISSPMIVLSGPGEA
ncbi:hypothetical protein AVEN_101010-1 [Araneus ventricosus]|uniref:Uncharacterized protein n=1 Tax=Araneus ventricosus TaxID=182803 RepID=A0A4Y2N651_ARAVE|nr:hypothetical protein AVEN_101010-1 [Araneus ventricosus]